MEIVINEMSFQDLDSMDLNSFDDFWNYNILREEILNTSSFCIVAKSENDIVGFAGLKFLLDEAHLANIVTRKDKRNLGIGTKMLDTLMKKANSTSTLITLEVNENNSPAIHLYEKFGFEKLGTRKKYYKNEFDAYIMTKHFN